MSSAIGTQTKVTWLAALVIALVSAHDAAAALIPVTTLQQKTNGVGACSLQEAIYSADFMKYGFTPGMGSTLVLPMKLGAALANEILLSERDYHGSTLRERGIGFPVVPAAETVATAVKLANDLADKSDVALEKAMHETTFAQPDVIDRLNQRLGG